jgi:hypothetical protein
MRLLSFEDEMSMMGEMENNYTVWTGKCKESRLEWE